MLSKKKPSICVKINIINFIVIYTNIKSLLFYLLNTCQHYYYLQENDLHTETNPFDIFKVRPLLKLKLSWSQEPTNGLVNRPKLYQQNSETNGIKKEAGTSKDRHSMQKCSTNDIKNGMYEENLFLFHPRFTG